MHLFDHVGEREREKRKRRLDGREAKGERKRKKKKDGWYTLMQIAKLTSPWNTTHLFKLWGWERKRTRQSNRGGDEKEEETVWEGERENKTDGLLVDAKRKSQPTVRCLYTDTRTVTKDTHLPAVKAHSEKCPWVTMPLDHILKCMQLHLPTGKARDSCISVWKCVLIVLISACMWGYVLSRDLVRNLGD